MIKVFLRIEVTAIGYTLEIPFAYSIDCSCASGNENIFADCCSDIYSDSGEDIIAETVSNLKSLLTNKRINKPPPVTNTKHRDYKHPALQKIVTIVEA